MTDFWKTKKFSKLSKTWERKLVESGFIDAEKTIKGERVLVQNSANLYRTTDEIFIETKREYYELVKHYEQQDNSLIVRDRFIIQKHAEGLKHKEILKEMRREGVACSHRITITRVISKFIQKWGIPKGKLHTRKR